MVWELISVFQKVSSDALIQDDDFSDRLNHRWTVSFLVMFCILVSSSQFVGDPIACWTPAQFTGAMIDYAHKLCWISSKYYVPTNSSLPNPNEKRAYRINYYQWVPFILLLMALLFYLPYSIWHVFSKPTGLDIQTVMKIISEMDFTTSGSKNKSILNAVKFIDRAIHYNRTCDKSFLGRFMSRIRRCLLPAFRSGNYTSVLYIVIKILYVINAFCQFLLLNAFMGNKFYLYGFDVIHDLMIGKNFWESYRFPRVIMCDFTIRNLAEHNHINTIQCTLQINLFNEKIFIFIWFWLCLVLIVSVYTLFRWLFAHLRSSRSKFVRAYLKTNKLDSKLLNEFLFEYLRLDGVFLLRLVKKNTNDILVSELVCSLWENFKNSSRFERKSSYNIKNEIINSNVKKEPEKLVLNQPSSDGMTPIISYSII